MLPVGIHMSNCHCDLPLDYLARGIVCDIDRTHSQSWNLLDLVFPSVLFHVMDGGRLDDSHNP